MKRAIGIWTVALLLILGLSVNVDMARPKGRRMRTVTVTAGPYATVRAVEEARRLFGPTVTVAGIIGPNWLNRYTYEVIDIDDLVEDEL